MDTQSRVRFFLRKSVWMNREGSHAADVLDESQPVIGEDETMTSITKIVDPKLPLTWILSIVFTATVGSVLAWNMLNQVAKRTEELEAAQRNYVVQTQNMQAEINMLKWRVERLEERTPRK